MEGFGAGGDGTVGTGGEGALDTGGVVITDVEDVSSNMIVTSVSGALT